MSVAWVAVALVVAACGGAEEVAPAADGALAGTAAPTAEAAGGPVANACPAEGCQVEIVDVEPEGEELSITWDANFLPDVSRNHIHVFWDIYTADQVSSDAEARGVEQGEWVPTDAFPTYVTEGVVSVANRGDSTTVCVTAADRDHAVLDAELVDCRDVADVLES